jgi:hypothetical protein
LRILNEIHSSNFIYCFLKFCLSDLCSIESFLRKRLVLFSLKFEINRVDIDFHCRSNNYRMVLENTIEIEGKWYLDIEIYFQEMKEE